MTTFKNLLLQNYWANYNQTWHKASSSEGVSRLFNSRDNLITKWGKYIENLLQSQLNFGQGNFNWRSIKFPQLEDLALSQLEIITNSKKVPTMFKNLLLLNYGTISNTHTMHPLVKGTQEFINQNHSILKKEIIDFFPFPNQHCYIIIAFRPFAQNLFVE